jgi:hypothetical protein
MIIAGSWVLGKIVWVTVLITLPILLWWTYFLFLWPELMKRSGSLEDYQQTNQDSIPQEGD